jgi:hypothetical protein
LGVGAGPIAGDELDARAGAEPPGHGRRLTVREKVDDAAPLQVDEDGAVAGALAEGEVVTEKRSGPGALGAVPADHAGRRAG